jgi:AraC family transcriptional activator of pyochelin receptor
MENTATFDFGELIRDDFKEYLGGTRDLRDCEKYLDEYKSFCWQWPDEIGDGFLCQTKLRDGLILGIGKVLFNERIHMSFDTRTFPLTFTYGVSGNMQYTFELENGCQNRWCSEAGQSAVSCLSELRGVMDCPAGTPVQWLSIHIDPIILISLVDLRSGRFPCSICDLAQGADTTEYQERFATSLPMDMAIHQILNCPYQGTLKRLYLEGKTLELLTHSLARLVQPGNVAQEKAAIRPQDIERVKYARDLIRKNLQDPPKLLDLARAVGLHHSKLNIGFREIYGTTIFDYLRQARLLMAKSLLDDGRMNVSETAFAVGFSSPSHFTKSFKDCFGIPPSTYLRTVSRKW